MPESSAGQVGLPCTENSVTARAVETTSDTEAFVRCAYDFVRQVGFEEARRAFHQDERWNSGPTYAFVTGLASEIVVSPVYPGREGGHFGVVVDLFNSDLFQDSARIISEFGQGWIHYSFLDPQTGLEEPKKAYVIGIDWEGSPAMIGSGIYRRDLPGSCHREQVNAAILNADGSDERLEEFVRCAALEVETKGLFATSVLTSDPRW